MKRRLMTFLFLILSCLFAGALTGCTSTPNEHGVIVD
jgi:hypothetical protein